LLNSLSGSLLNSFDEEDNVDHGTNPNPYVVYGTNPNPNVDYGTVITPRNHDFTPLGLNRGLTPLPPGSDRFLIPSTPDQVPYFISIFILLMLF
jgi:hypothetical protein